MADECVFSARLVMDAGKRIRRNSMFIKRLITKLIDFLFSDDTCLEGPCRFRDKGGTSEMQTADKEKSLP